MSQLKVLIAESIFTVSGGTITLRPFKFKQFNAALNLIEPYLKKLSTANTTAEIMEQFLAKDENGGSYTVLDDLLKLLSMVSGKTSEFFDDCTYDEVIGLIGEVISMNLDFFSRLGAALNKDKEKQEEVQKTGE